MAGGKWGKYWGGVGVAGEVGEVGTLLLTLFVPIIKQLHEFYYMVPPVFCTMFAFNKLPYNPKPCIALEWCFLRIVLQSNGSKVLNMCYCQKITL